MGYAAECLDEIESLFANYEEVLGRLRTASHPGFNPFSAAHREHFLYGGKPFSFSPLDESKSTSVKTILTLNAEQPDSILEDLVTAIDLCHALVQIEQRVRQIMSMFVTIVAQTAKVYI